MIDSVAFIAYPVTDLARSRAFYEGVLGLKPTLVSPNFPWVEYDIGATTLGIGVSPEWKPSSDGACVALEVDDFNAAIARLKEQGARFVKEAFETPVCHMAIVSDPDGSGIIIHKRK